MRFLADENFPLVALKRLSERGVDIVRIESKMEGTDDRTLLEHARRANRVLVTFDKDFGELIFKELRGTIGVIYFRMPKLGVPRSIDRIVSVLTAPVDFQHRFTVIDENRIRTRMLIR